MSEAAGHLVVFTPSGRRGRFVAGTTVLDAARSLGVDIDSVCGGRGLCGRCQVTQSVGSFPKHAIESTPEHLSGWASREQEYTEKKAMDRGRRLSCAVEVRGDAVIDVPPESQVHKQVVRKGLTVREFVIDPVVRLHYVEVERPTLETPGGDLARLFESLEREWGLTGLEADLAVVRELQPALERGSYGVTVAVHDGRIVSAVWPGLQERVLGVAVDIGSTTIAGHLADLGTGEVLASHGVMNPQIRFGEDLMSRVSYAMLHEGGAGEMTRAVRAALGGLFRELVTMARVHTNEIHEIVLVGNPIMHHLALGIDPVPLGSAPFALATDRAVRVRASEIGLPAHAGARVYVLPCIAGHVGADTAAVILAEAPHRTTGTRLVVDVGTNAEIVLAVDGQLLAASSPTGPAFEGAQISAGQRAAPGAIERVRIDRATLEPRFRIIGVDAWSDEPGFAEAAASTGVTGICGSGIVEVIAELFLAGVIAADGTIDGSTAARSPRVIADGRTFSYVLHEGDRQIAVTQNDVRAIQLAKAALYAGVRLLMDHAGVDTVDAVRLAGAFGSQIDLVHAMVLGLVPDCDLANAGPAGNAAGTGALIALLSKAARDEIEQVARDVRKIETAVEPRFQAHFVDAMAIPHKTASMPHLSAVVTLPERSGSGAPASGRRENPRRRAGRAVVAAAEDER